MISHKETNKKALIFSIFLGIILSIPFILGNYYEIMSFYLSCVVLTVVLVTIYIVASKTINRYITFGAPYVITTKDRIEFIVKLFEKEKKEKVIDLGSGDGVILFKIKDHIKTGTGIELNPLLVLFSNIKKILTKSHNLSFYQENIWNHNLSKYDAIIVAGIPYIMPKLQQKILAECKKNVLIVTIRFDFPDQNIIKNKLNAKIHLI